MTRILILTAIVLTAVGCQEKLEVTNNPEPPKLTQEQLNNMPPEAAAHASNMSEYSKAMAEQNKARAPR